MQTLLNPDVYHDDDTMTHRTENGEVSVLRTLAAQLRGELETITASYHEQVSVNQELQQQIAHTKQESESAMFTASTQSHQHTSVVKPMEAQRED